MLRYTSFTILFFILGNGFSFAQDVRFSQYYAAPTYFNPALTGAYEGSFRLTSLYRDQWRGALDDPYVSYTVSGDVRYDVGRRGTPNRDFAAGGILFMQDQVDVIDFSTTFIALTGAYHKTLNEKKNSYLSFGLRIGIAQKRINYEHINFQDQFDGVDDYPLSTNEILPRNNFSFPDLALGLHYTISPEEGSLFNIGGSIDHVIPADISFYQEVDPTITTFEYPDNVLFRRYSADASYLFPIGQKETSLRPRAAYTSQGPFQEALAGMNWQRRIGALRGNNIHLGAYLRLNNYLDGFGPSAAVAMMGFELQDVLLGLSYDMSITGSNLASRNVFEFSIIYIDDFVNDSYLCPTF